jgi:hypothetical protein
VPAACDDEGNDECDINVGLKSKKSTVHAQNDLFCAIARTVRLAYQLSASSTFLSEKISSTFLSEKISHQQPAVLFSQKKSATSNQSIVLFSQSKPAPAVSHQPNEQAAECPSLLNRRE